jgi:hypothetical protein
MRRYVSPITDFLLHLSQEGNSMFHLGHRFDRFQVAIRVGCLSMFGLGFPMAIPHLGRHAVAQSPAELAAGASVQPKATGIECLELEEGQPSAPVELSEFQWMVGAWEGEGLGGKCSEVWGPALGGAMVGSFSFAEADQLIFSEHFTLSKEENSVVLKLKHFDDQLAGWEEKDKYVTFRFIKRDRDEFYFNGLTYARRGEDTLVAAVRIKHDDGTVGTSEFVFKRVK